MENLLFEKSGLPITGDGYFWMFCVVELNEFPTLIPVLKTSVAVVLDKHLESLLKH